MSQEERQDIVEGRRPVTYYVAIDPAISESERADYTAVIICAMDAERKLYMVDAIRDRLDGREQVDLILALQKRYNPEFIAIEKEKITKAIGPFLREEMFKQNLFPTIVEIQPSKDLETRGRSWQGRMRVGGVKFDKGADWYPQYEAELTTFPRGIKDDYVASSAVLGLALDKMIEAPTVKEYQDEEWEEEFKRTMEDHDGRSEHTGY
jgi:predicted phage terminase large subunit-like protein